MKTQRRRPVLNIPKLLITGLLAAQMACVTVNVNFPESVVQKAADDYVRELYGDSEKASGKKDIRKSDQSRLDQILEVFLPRAEATEINVSFKTDTPAIREIQGRQKSRISKIDQLKRQGFIGETKDGKLTLRNEAELKKLQQKQAEKLVEEENSDRAKLYDQVLSTNSMSSDKSDLVENSFATSFQKSSPAGTPVQNQDGSWKKK